MLFDTHCHLNFSAFKDDAFEVIGRMAEEGIRAIVVGSQITTSARAVEMAQAHPGRLFAAVALHPLHLFERDVTEVEIPFHTRAEKFSEKEYAKLAHEPEVVAIGECGLDYFAFPQGIPEASCKRKQRDVFEQHIALAQKAGLPLIVHVRAHPKDYRDAYEDVFDVLKNAGHPKAVIHAFATFPDLAKKFLDAGYMISFTGLITYPEYAVLNDVVRAVPLERMMIETDSPYMAPQSIRGQRNDPTNVRLVAEHIAHLHRVPLETVASATTSNAENFFKIKKELSST